MNMYMMLAGKCHEFIKACAIMWTPKPTASPHRPIIGFPSSAHHRFPIFVRRPLCDILVEKQSQLVDALLFESPLLNNRQIVLSGQWIGNVCRSLFMEQIGFLLHPLVTQEMIDRLNRISRHNRELGRLGTQMETVN